MSILVLAFCPQRHRNIGFTSGPAILCSSLRSLVATATDWNTTSHRFSDVETWPDSSDLQLIYRHQGTVCIYIKTRMIYLGLPIGLAISFKWPLKGMWCIPYKTRRTFQETLEPTAEARRRMPIDQESAAFIALVQVEIDGFMENWTMGSLILIVSKKQRNHEKSFNSGLGTNDNKTIYIN